MWWILFGLVLVAFGIIFLGGLWLGASLAVPTPPPPQSPLGESGHD